MLADVGRGNEKILGSGGGRECGWRLGVLLCFPWASGIIVTWHTR